MADKQTIQNASTKLNEEIFSLNPSALITLYEIDISNLLWDAGYLSEALDPTNPYKIFRFHNIPTQGQSIWWNDKEYTATPIQAEGFEITSQGTLPTPKLAISARTEGAPLLSQLKIQIRKLGDLVGAKVTRIRTLSKFLDAKNFPPDLRNEDADPYAEFPRDVFYIDRKTNENKQVLEYELASILDVEGIKLPRRLVISDKCPWSYRGEGCLYEYVSRRNSSIHGETSTLPSDAPSIATSTDEYIHDILNKDYAGDQYHWMGWFDVGHWVNYDNVPYGTFNVGEQVYIERDGIKYYYICRKMIPPYSRISPPNPEYWIADECSKTIKGCKIRWGIDSSNQPGPGQSYGNPHGGCLPFGGFPAVGKLSSE